MLPRLKKIKRSSWAILALIIALLVSVNQIRSYQETILRFEAKRDQKIALSGYHVWREFDSINSYTRSAWENYEAGDVEQAVASLKEATPRLRILSSLVEIYNDAISHQWLQNKDGVFYQPSILSPHITAGWANRLDHIARGLTEHGQLNPDQIKQFKAIQFDIDRFAYHFPYDVLETGDPQQLEYALTHWCGTLQTDTAKFVVDSFGTSSFVACDYFDEMMEQQGQK